MEERSHTLDKGEVEHEYRVTELFLPDQNNTHSHTEIPEKEVALVVTSLVQQNKKAEMLRFHWHSHSDMDVFHSGEDEENYTNLKTGEWLISLVVNKRKDLFARVDIYKPIHISICSIPVFMESSTAQADTERISKRIAEIKERDTPPVYKNQIEFGYSTNENRFKYTTPISAPDERDRDRFFEQLSLLEHGGFISVLKDRDNTPLGYKDLETGKYFEIIIEEMYDWEVKELLGKENEEWKSKYQDNPI